MISVDQMKAFDRVLWNFLFKLLLISAQSTFLGLNFCTQTSRRELR